MCVYNRAAMADAKRHLHAWLALVAALALHVVDEALTGFLEFYNPLVLSIRSQVPWFPMPTLTFEDWMTLLVVVLIVLTLFALVVRRGGVIPRLASWIFATIMLLNGIAHLAGSVYFDRWLPGATTAPLMIAGSIWLFRATRRRD
jgi:hypothetical protein